MSKRDMLQGVLKGLRQYALLWAVGGEVLARNLEVIPGGQIPPPSRGARRRVMFLPIMIVYNHIKTSGERQQVLWVRGGYMVIVTVGGLDLLGIDDPRPFIWIGSCLFDRFGKG